MLGMAVINAIVFGVQGNMMRNCSDTVLNHSITGAVAGAAQSFICSPMELIKLRLQVQTNPTEMFHWSHSTNNGGRVYLDPWDATKKIIQRDGIRGFFKGLELTLTRETPAFAIYFSTYEYTCNLIMRKTNIGTADDLSPLALCLAGGLSGVTSWMMTYPIDVVKSRMQVDGMFGHRAYSSIWDCVVKSAREPEGLMIFWKGINSTLIRGFIFNAATLPTVSLILRYWRKLS
jgi:solute carrier family 25 carnitine/acylcarnitine transporter 20/29